MAVEYPPRRSVKHDDPKRFRDLCRSDDRRVGRVVGRDHPAEALEARRDQAADVNLARADPLRDLSLAHLLVEAEVHDHLFTRLQAAQHLADEVAVQHFVEAVLLVGHRGLARAERVQ